jgi:hypothetical protein
MAECSRMERCIVLSCLVSPSGPSPALHCFVSVCLFCVSCFVRVRLFEGQGCGCGHGHGWMERHRIPFALFIEFRLASVYSPGITTYAGKGCFLSSNIRSPKSHHD